MMILNEFKPEDAKVVIESGLITIEVGREAKLNFHSSVKTKFLLMKCNK